LPVIQALVECNNELTDQLAVLTVVLGVSLRTNDAVRLVSIAAIEAELELGLATFKVMARLRTFPEMDECTMSSSELYRFVQSQLRAKLIVEKNRK
jgi:hypothetical protein